MYSSVKVEMKWRIAASVLGVTLGVLSLTTSAQDCPEPLGRSPEGASFGIAADGSTAYLANGATVTVVDLSNPALPSVVGSVALPYSIRHLAQDGDRVYVMTRVHLHVVDVSNPEFPLEIGRLAFEGYHLDADGDLLCVQTDNGLRVFDVSTPATPTMVGTWPTGGSNDFRVVDERVYVSNIGLQILDLSDPTDPTQIGHLDLPVIGKIDVVGDTVYAIDDTQGLVVVDVGDPTAPVRLGTFSEARGGDVAVHRDLAYLTGWPDGLAIVDVGDPARPVLAGTVPRPPDEDWRSVAAVADHGLVSSLQHGLRVIDATDASAPSVEAGIPVPGFVEHAAHADSTLFIAAWERGLRAVDVSDPGNPKDLAFLALDGSAEAIDVEGDLAVVVGRIFKVVDVADPATPVVVGGIPGMTGGRAVEVVGDLAYVSNAEDGLHIVDITTPSVPSEIGSLDPGGPAWWAWNDLAVSGDTVFMSGFGSIEVIDVSDPTHPVSVADIPGTVYSVAVFRSWLLVGSPFDLRIFDVRNASNPVELDPYPTTGWIHHVGMSESVAWLGIQMPGEYNTWIEVVDVGNPFSPVFLGRHLGAGFPAPGFAFDQRMAYSFKSPSGFDTFARCQGPLFADGFESGDTTTWSSAVP
jgi:hypothetical protein